MEQHALLGSLHHILSLLGLALFMSLGATRPEAVIAQAPKEGLVQYEFHHPHTTIRFTAGFLGIVKVEGRFDEFYGTFLLNEDDVTQSSLEVVVLSSSVNSNAVGRDRDLRSQRFLDIVRFPGATFRSTKITERGEAYLAVGDLTIRDVTREIEVPFQITGRTTFPFSETSVIGLEAHFAFNRQDFGMTWEQVLDGGALFASNEVEMDAKIALVEVAAQELEAEERYPPVALEEEGLAAFSGTYASRDPVQEVQVELIGGHLTALIEGDLGTGFYQLLSLGSSTFRVAALSSGDLGFLRFEEKGGAVFERRGAQETRQVLLTRLLTFEGFQRLLVEEGLPAALARYHSFREEAPAWFEPFDEEALNRLARQYLRADQAETAIGLYQLNVEAYPTSWRAFESLAEAYLARGDKASALLNLEKALALDPENEALKERLASVREE